ncbi:MAG: hypothetical protein ACRENI_02450 [Gemmatimonadaceae bacterium]
MSSEVPHEPLEAAASPTASGIERLAAALECLAVRVRQRDLALDDEVADRAAAAGEASTLAAVLSALLSPEK